MALNRIMLIGNAGKDADLRYSAQGMANASFSLAVNNRRRGQNGEFEDETEWFNVKLFGDTAEKVSKFITKGKQLYVEGRIQTRQWEDADGNKRTSVDVLANSVQLLGGRDQDGDQPRQRDDWNDTKKGGKSRDEALDIPFE